MPRLDCPRVSAETPPCRNPNDNSTAVSEYHNSSYNNRNGINRTNNSNRHSDITMIMMVIILLARVLASEAPLAGSAPRAWGAAQRGGRQRKVSGFWARKIPKH